MLLQSRNTAMLAQCFYQLEDFAGLTRLVDVLTEGQPLLADIGRKLQSVGLCTEAVAAFAKVCAGFNPPRRPLLHDQIGPCAVAAGRIKQLSTLLSGMSHGMLQGGFCAELKAACACVLDIQSTDAWDRCCCCSLAT